MERSTYNDIDAKAGRFNDGDGIRNAIEEMRFRLDDTTGVSVAFPETPDLVELRPEVPKVKPEPEMLVMKPEQEPPMAAAAEAEEPEKVVLSAEELRKMIQAEEKARSEKAAEAETADVTEKASEAETPDVADKAAVVQAAEVISEEAQAPEEPAKVVEELSEIVAPEKPAPAAEPVKAAPPVKTAEPVKAAEKPVAKPAAQPAGRGNVITFGQEPVLPYSMEEAINRLRINISFLGNDVKKIMIVSSEPNEGKSFIAMNLWKQMAISGEPSILLDLDMRKSNIVEKYQLKREDGRELKGMTHFLSGNEPVENMIMHTYMEHGDILPNVDNVVNPSMLLESRKFSEMMQYMENHYRYVFVDVPPLGLVSDGELIGNVCDGALLCVRGGVTSRAIVRRSIRQIERAGCQILGIVLNRVGGSGTGYYHKYYGKKYYYNDQYYSKG